MKVLLIGDIVGRAGRLATTRLVPELRQELGIDLVVANVENASAGFGMTAKTYKQLLPLVDFMTSGNHIWDKKEINEEIKTFSKLIRPANYCADNVPGKGYGIIEINKKKICIINLLGRVFLNNEVSSPFEQADKIINQVQGKVDIILVDFHAEATSEKVALANYLDGRVTLVVGTHTHVQTADERILPKGTGYLTDLGMVGATDSILGMQKEAIIKKFLNGLPQRFEPEIGGQITFNALLATFDNNNQVNQLERIKRNIFINE